MTWSHRNLSQHCYRLCLFEIDVQLNPLKLQTLGFKTKKIIGHWAKHCERRFVEIMQNLPLKCIEIKDNLLLKFRNEAELSSKP